MSKPIADEDPLAALERLNNEIHPSPARTSKPTTKPGPAAAAVAAPEDDPLAKLESHLKAKPLSRPNTPKLTRASEDRKARRSAESSTPLQHELTPTSEDEMRAAEREIEEQEQEQGGGWWGGIFATASKVKQQAEAAVAEMRRNEEAQKWAEQVKGNVDVLRGFGRCGK